MRSLCAATATVVAAFPLAFSLGFAQGRERPFPEALRAFTEEANARSEAPDLARDLADIYGPRLTGSPHVRAAGEFVLRRLKGWNLGTARFERWGPFGPGWTTDRFVALVVSPVPFALHAYPKAWTPATPGDVVAEAVLAVITTDADFATYRGTLRDKFVLIAPPTGPMPPASSRAGRYSPEELSVMANTAAPPAPASVPKAADLEFVRRRMAFFIEEGVAALLEPGGDSGAVVVTDGRMRDDAAFGGDGFYPWPDAVATQIVVATEHYNRIARMVQHDAPVTLEVNVANNYHTAEPDSFNIVAEIPGSDRANEVVILGAHFDSWHAATGAADNAAGAAVMLDAMRILSASGLTMRRTIRLVLWTGSEQGLLGSRGYVAEHFADPAVMTPKPEHPLISAYFNLDRGSGAIRGIYLQGNSAAGLALKPWAAGVREHGAATLSPWTTADSDHRSFDAVGIPAFEFIQDPLDFESRARHSSADTYDRVQRESLVKNAALVASLAHYVANLDERLPRKPLPKPDKNAAGPWSPGR